MSKDNLEKSAHQEQTNTKYFRLHDIYHSMKDITTQAQNTYIKRHHYTSIITWRNASRDSTTPENTGDFFGLKQTGTGFGIHGH